MYTAELRWFYWHEFAKGTAFEKWIMAGEPEERTDRMLFIDGLQTAGIKMRNGELEVKVRIGEREAIRMAGVEGYAGRWLKVQASMEDWSEQSSIPLTKTRWLKRWAVEGETAKEITGERTVEGCDCEYGIVKAGTRRWRTLCLEAFGSPGSVRTNLEAVIPLAPLDSLRGVLDCAHSASYPEWLQTLRSNSNQG